MNALTLVALVAWCFVALASQVHEATARHEVCDDHGTVVEASGGSGDRPVEAGATLRAAELGSHHDGCTMPAAGPPLALDAASAAVREPAPAAIDRPAPRSGRWARVALSYAPKTSPPRA